MSSCTTASPPACRRSVTPAWISSASIAIAAASSPAPASAGCGPSSRRTPTYVDSGRNPRKISPFFVPSTIINMIAGHLSIRYGLRGPNLGVVTACTTSTHAIGLGGARHPVWRCGPGGRGRRREMATTPTGLGGFAQAKALSTRNDSPQTASRPWDQGTRRLRAQRRRRSNAARGVRACARARRAHLRRAGWFRHER